MPRDLSSRQDGSPSEVHFQVISRLGKRIITTTGYWRIIVNIKHPSIRGRDNEVKKTLRSPDYIRRSYVDKRIYLFYKQCGGNYLCVIVRHLNGKGFIITTYLTNKIKEGKQIWPKKQIAK